MSSSADAPDAHVSAEAQAGTVSRPSDAPADGAPTDTIKADPTDTTNTTDTTDDDDDDDDMGGLFEDPPDFYPPSPPPTTQQHALGRSGVQLTLHLVGHSPLEAHRLWNGSRVLADYLEDEAAQGRYLVRGKTVLELGAGAGLPGIVCGLVLGAHKSVVTDYPDPDLIATIAKNIGECEAAAKTAVANNAARGTTTSPELLSYRPGTIVADGYVWGADPEPLLAHINGERPETPSLSAKYDVVLLADLLFRHAEHAKIAYTVQQTLAHSPDSRAYVFFTSYRPWLRYKDLHFFAEACAAGLIVEHLLEKRLENPPLFFENDPGDVSVRSTVSGYALRWPQLVSEPNGNTRLEDPRDFWPPPGGVEGAEEPQAHAGTPWSHRAPPP